MRAAIKTLTVVIFVLAVAWLGAWWAAESWLQNQIFIWTSPENLPPGEQITYDSITRGNSPLAATVSVSNLRVSSQPPDGGPAFSAVLPSFGLGVYASDPLTLHQIWPGQVNVSTPRADFAVTFGSIAAEERIDPRALLAHARNPFSGGDFAAKNINLLASGGSLEILQIGGVTVHEAIDKNAGAAGTALASTVSLDGVALAPLLTRLGNVPFGGQIAHVALSLGVSGPVPANLAMLLAMPEGDDRNKAVLAALQGWAAAGGNAKGSLNLVVGPSTLAADYALKFDRAQQPVGTLDLTANHLDDFTAALTSTYPPLQNDVNGFEARFSPYLASTDSGGQTLTMNVAFGNGAVSVNGNQVSVLPPINWALLLANPAPAPGDGSGAAQ